MRRIDMDMYTVEIRGIWQMICCQMNQHRVDPVRLAAATPYSLEHIERGIAGEVIPVTLPFLRACVGVLGILGGRTEPKDRYTKREDNLSYEECLELLEPTPVMPPRQGNYWEWYQ